MAAVISTTSTSDPPPSAPGDPAWAVALLFPPQGQWTEDEYLALDQRNRRLVEFSDGQVEVLPMPNAVHQRIAGHLYRLLYACVAALGGHPVPRVGEVFFAPLPIRLWAGKYRDPDVVYLKPGRISDPRRQPEGADLAIEVLSDEKDDRERDLVTKRQEYAQAGIAEYWIVDPKTQTILVLVLDGAAYRVHGEFPRGTTAVSVLLPGFAADVAAVFDAGLGRAGAGFATA